MSYNASINHDSYNHYDDTKPLLGPDDVDIKGEYVFEPARKWNSPRLIYLLIFLIIYCIGFVFAGSMTLLRLVQIYKSRGLSDEEATAAATSFYGYLSLIKASGTFLLSPVFGALSDRFGRKPLLAIGCISSMIDLSSYIVVDPMWIFFVTKTGQGLFDGVFTVIMAAIADVTPVHRRAFGFAMFSVSFGVSLIGFPAVAGIVADKLGFPMVFYISIGVMGLGLLVLLIIPETNQNLSQEALNWRKLNPVMSFSLLFKNSNTLFLSFVLLLLSFALEGIMDVYTSYIKFIYENKSNFMMGSLASAAGVGMVLSGPLTRFVVPLLGDRKAASIGIFIGTIGVLATPFSWSWWQLYPLTVLRCFAYMANPTLQAMLCAEYTSDQLAPLMGVLTSLKTISGVLGPLFFPFIFERTTMHEPKIPGMVLYIVAGLNGLSFISLVVYFTVHKKTKPREAISEVEPASTIQ